MVDYRAVATGILQTALPRGKLVYSNDPKNNPEFKRLAHGEFDQDELMRRWTVLKQQDTSCAAFVNWYSDNLKWLADRKSKPLIGFFEPEQKLAAMGMSHAWVDAASAGDHPYPGDVIRHKIYHVDVCGECDGSSMTRVAGGQGKVGQYDIIRRCDSESYDPSLYRGWIDIEIFYGTDPQSPKGPPDWLVDAYWEVTWRGAYYYYWFDGDGQTVYWCDSDYVAWGFPPVVPGGTGRYTYTVNEPATRITIYWDSGSVETFKLDMAASTWQMNGRWNNSEPLYASLIDGQ